MGINLNALALFSGAIGVGLSLRLRLQTITSNFILKIILLDKSIPIGDFIELENNQKRLGQEFTMRRAGLDIYDGKYILAPNETFISSLLIN